MSEKVMSMYLENLNKEFRKNSKFIEGKLIRYNKDESDSFEFMRKGYLDMAKINLENSEPSMSNKVELMYEFDNINEYEKWLCGV